MLPLKSSPCCFRRTSTCGHFSGHAFRASPVPMRTTFDLSCQQPSLLSVATRLAQGPRFVPAAGQGFGAPAKDARSEISDKPCPCGSQKPYCDCCQKWHTEDMAPMEPEAALRARFSAYVLKDAKYILRSTHPRNPATKGSEAVAGSLVRKVKTTYNQDVRASMSFGDYSDLSNIVVEPGANEDESLVSFEYKMKQVRTSAGEKLSEPRLHLLTEKSRFQRKQGEWLLLGSESNWDKKEMRTTS